MDDQFRQGEIIKNRHQGKDFIGTVVPQPAFYGKLQRQSGHGFFQDFPHHAGIGKHARASFFMGHPGKRATQVPVDFFKPLFLAVLPEKDDLAGVLAQDLRHHRNAVVTGLLQLRPFGTRAVGILHIGKKEGKQLVHPRKMTGIDVTKKVRRDPLKRGKIDPAGFRFQKT